MISFASPTDNIELVGVGMFASFSAKSEKIYGEIKVSCPVTHSLSVAMELVQFIYELLGKGLNAFMPG